MPSWEKASKTALAIFSALGNKNDLRLKLRFLPDRSAVFARIEESVSENVPFAKAKVMPYPSYSITDKRHVGDLIAALDETSIFGMAIAIPHFIEIGDKIANLHPFTFMQIAIGDPHLRVQFNRVFNNSLKRWGFMNGNGVREGFRHQLEREVSRGDLEPHIDQLASRLQASPEIVRALIRDQAWSELYFYLLETASAQKAQEFQAR